MGKIGIGLLATLAAALVVGCGADVDKPSESFVAEVDLQATASGPSSITPGTNAEFTFTVRNAGPEPANDVDVDFVFGVGGDVGSGVMDPASTRWTCEATAGSCAESGGISFSGTSVSLENGGEAVFTFRVPIEYSAPPGGEFEASVTVGEDGTWPDPNPDNNNALAMSTIGAAPALADFRDEIIYWAFTDRFANGDPSNDNGDGSRPGDGADPANPLGWHGGDLAGITQKIEEGYFQGMGFTAIWISPVAYQVPARNDLADEFFAAYHGYWPEATLELEPHFGTVADLTALVETAHANGLKIIVDFVANHVGYDAQVIQTNRDWVRLGSECGPSEDRTNTCLSGLPDLKQENPEVEAFLLTQMQNLVETTGIDGFRWDAFRHVNDDFWTVAFAPGAPGDRSVVWSVGESFTSEPAEIAYQLDSVGAPGMFDFPLLYTGLGPSTSAFTDSISESLSASDPVYADPTRLVTFLDNHDIPRITTGLMEGGGASRGEALEWLDALLTFLYGNRGIPMVYYGTEIGMEGFGDPFGWRDGNSNREDMDFTLAGDPNFLTCGVANQGNDNAFVNGEGAFLRGSFIDWADPAPAANQMFSEGGGIYAQALELSAGSYFFKVAGQTWSGWERTYDAEPLALGAPVTLNTGGNNTVLELAADGCFRFEMDASASTDNPTLTVTRLNVAAPLVRRLAALAAARQAYPALRRGTQTVLYDFAEQCSVPPTWPPSALPGQLFVRGGFNDWADPAAPETGFVRTGLNTYEAEFQFGAGTYGYKIATGDWSYELVVEGQETPLDTELALVAGGPNSEIMIPADGCYNFALDATDPDAMTLQVTADDDGTCQAVSGDPDAAAFGQPVFVRGDFNGWDTPRESDRFAAAGPDVLKARVGLNPRITYPDPGGELQYKIASADYSVERVVIGGPTRIDTRQLLGIPSGNGIITPEVAGCYEWTMEVAEPDLAYLTVTGPIFSSDIFVLRRDLEGEASVVLVYNSGDAADLADFGGIPVDGLADGAPVEITGAQHDLVISGGRLSGTVPARTAYLISDR